MTEKEIDAKFRSIDKELDDIKRKFEAGQLPPGAIRVPTYDLPKQPDELLHLVETQKTLIQALRVTVQGFGPKFDKLCSDEEKRRLNPTEHDAEGIVWGEEGQ